MLFLGKTYNGYGEIVGDGLELDEDGSLLRVLTAEQTGHLSENLEAVRGSYITPGFVDIHCHGGGGFGFSDDYEPEQIQAAIKTHQRAGTTGMLASLVSLANPVPQLEALSSFCASGELAGIHMEGPFLSKEKCGAQNPAVLRPVDTAELSSWLRISRGWIRTMTVAPEVEGAMEAAKLLFEHGAKPSWGHSNDSGQLTRGCLESSFRLPAECNGSRIAQTVTHLFNAMPQINHRVPGPVREYLQAARMGMVSVELIADGHHLSEDLVEDVLEYLYTMPADEECLGALFVTDSLAAAGMEPGRYTLGGLSVEVRSGACYLAGTDTLAGGASTLAEQFKLFAHRGRVKLPALIRSCVCVPAIAGSIEDRPGVTLDFALGEKPNLLVFNEEHEILKVVREGAQL